MTTQELSQLYYLDREIKADQRRLKELECQIRTPRISRITQTPVKNTTYADRIVERITAEIADLQAVIAERQIRCIHERARLERWINDIPDSLTRQIFVYRFAEKMSWMNVALKVGGSNTVDSVRQRVYRYLNLNNNLEDGL